MTYNVFSGALNPTQSISTEDCHFVGFLELINNMLTSGMVPALHNDEEKEQIIGQVCYHDRDL